mgnify:CR=1 FL=1
MSGSNQDFFFLGEAVPETIKQSIYKMEDTNKAVTGKSVFEDVMTGLLDNFLPKKNISLVKVEKFNNEKVKHLKTYVLYYQNDKGDEFKCSYIGEKDSLHHGTTHILASSIVFTFAGYGCKHCKYKDKDCEFCERKKIDKIFPPELKLTIKSNMKEFTKVLGKESVKVIKDFCDGYFAFMRGQKDEEVIQNNVQKEKDEQAISPEIAEITELDIGVIDYIIKVVSSILGQYANDNKDIRNILSDYSNVEKTFLFVINQLQRYYAFVKSVKENPEAVPEEIVDMLRNTNDDIIDEIDEDDDEDDDDEGESWKKGNQDEDE